jgi:hypothetical protein
MLERCNDAGHRDWRRRQPGEQRIFFRALQLLEKCVWHLVRRRQHSRCLAVLLDGDEHRVGGGCHRKMPSI